MVRVPEGEGAVQRVNLLVVGPPEQGPDAGEQRCDASPEPGTGRGEGRKEQPHPEVAQEPAQVGRPRGQGLPVEEQAPLEQHRQPQRKEQEQDRLISSHGAASAGIGRHAGRRFPTSLPLPPSEVQSAGRSAAVAAKGRFTGDLFFFIFREVR